MEEGVGAGNITDVIDLAARCILRQQGAAPTEPFLDQVADAKTRLRYKYLTRSDSLAQDRKRDDFDAIVATLPPVQAPAARILDIGGSSTGNSLALADRLSPSHCHITLQDISQASLDAALPLYQGHAGVSVDCQAGDIRDFAPAAKYDYVLCLGVLMCVAEKAVFESLVQAMAKTMNPSSWLISRDCLHEGDGKQYLPFGGVVRSRKTYQSAFHRAGLNAIDQRSFVMETPIQRTILTTAWRLG